MRNTKEKFQIWLVNSAIEDIKYNNFYLLGLIIGIGYMSIAKDYGFLYGILWIIICGILTNIYHNFAYTIYVSCAFNECLDHLRNKE